MSASLDYGNGSLAAIELDVFVDKRLKELGLGSSIGRSKRRSRRKNKFFRENPNCYWCGEVLNRDNRSLDHLVPKVKGGSNDPSNLVASCKPCNNEKGDELPDAYQKRRQQERSRVV